MEARIKIQDINSSYLEELSDDSLLQVIIGGEPSTETSLAYDIGYAIGWAADKVRDGWNWLTE
ncbi:MAG: hypothetical protein HWQ41_16005 [Nostoc sp. NOS(2021)]|uniref:hypothetical protein n=1 Tax=Nostoc sp. NOS(2021) TaxID=2815407 RepID=UPI0025EE5BB1|nr:hypothetical protein [Nostoc sp. NOS(2021)]MBN3896709.1 hypothetical protein [Nostoc sp. NOS(2021)]